MAARLPFATTVGVPIGGYVPAIEWFSAGPHHAPENDVRDHAFAHHTKLYASFLPSHCATALKEESYLCLIPRLAWPYRQQPLFVIEALTDACVLCSFEGVGESDDSCWVPLVAGGKLRPKSEQTWMSAYGRNASRSMAQILASPRDGLFAASCFLHCGFTLEHPKINNTMVVDALFSWVQTYLPNAGHHAYPGGARPHNGTNFKWIDTCAGPSGGEYWPPCNPSCPIIPKIATERVWLGQ